MAGRGRRSAYCAALLAPPLNSTEDAEPAALSTLDSGAPAGTQAADGRAAGAGQQVGRYRTLRVLGQGSAGVVHTAYDQLLDRVVALKTVRTPCPAARNSATTPVWGPRPASASCWRSGVRGVGDRKLHEHGVTCLPVGQHGYFAERQVPSAVTRHRVVLRATLFPDRGMIECTADDDGQRTYKPSYLATRPSAGPYTLVIGNTAPHATNRVVAEIRRITLRGARLDDVAVDASPAAAIARALVASDTAAALAALAVAPPEDPRHALLALLIHDALGRPAAPEVLGLALSDVNRRAVGTLLHARAQIHRQLGRRAHARRDYEGALVAFGDTPDPPGEPLRAAIHLALASMLVESDADSALAHLTRAVACDEAPELALDRLRREPRILARAAADPAWSRALLTVPAYAACSGPADP